MIYLTSCLKYFSPILFFPQLHFLNTGGQPGTLKELSHISASENTLRTCSCLSVRSHSYLQTQDINYSCVRGPLQSGPLWESFQMSKDRHRDSRSTRQRPAQHLAILALS